MIKIYTTGGSIDKAYSTKESSFVVGEPQIGSILRQANVVVQYEVESLLKKDSLEITDHERQRIAERIAADPHRQIVITHGTDTMVETAMGLTSLGGKVIVLTGAMQPARLRSSDALFNVGFAAACVQLLPHGVYIAMNGRIFEPVNVRKNVAESRFETLS